MSPLLANKLDESVKCIPINLVRSTGPDGEAQREGVQILHLEKIFVGSCSFNFPPRLFDELWVWTIMCVTSRRNSLIGSTELTAREALCEDIYEDKHRKNCECCPVSQLIVRLQYVD